MSLRNVARINKVNTKKEFKAKYGIGWTKKDPKSFLDKEDYRKYLRFIAFAPLFMS
tara:strand:- start:656 stop:823 length:168 start_codon:yes stop_codon:yes gene_type:complete